MKILFSAHQSCRKTTARCRISEVIIKIKYLIECDKQARIIIMLPHSFVRLSFSDFESFFVETETSRNDESTNMFEGSQTENMAAKN